MDLLQVVTDPVQAMRVVLGALVIKVGLALLLAIVQGKFDFKRLPEYLQTDVLPLGAGLVILWLATLIDPTLTPVYTGSANAVTVYLGYQSAQQVKGFLAIFRVQPDGPPKPIEQAAASRQQD